MSERLHYHPVGRRNRTACVYSILHPVGPEHRQQTRRARLPHDRLTSTVTASPSVVLTVGGLFRFREFVNNAAILVHKSTVAILAPPARPVPKYELLVG